MRFMPTHVHGLLDYLVGLLLIAAPWVFNFDRGGAETWVPIILGAGALAYSLLTDYEPGVTERLPMGTHLRFELLSGIHLSASLWLFGFREFVYVPPPCSRRARGWGRLDDQDDALPATGIPHGVV